MTIELISVQNKELLKAASTGARREVVRLIRAGADIDCNNIDKVNHFIFFS